jgi:hypothetical protein
MVEAFGLAVGMRALNRCLRFIPAQKGVEDIDPEKYLTRLARRHATRVDGVGALNGPAIGAGDHGGSRLGYL